MTRAMLVPLLAAGLLVVAAGCVQKPEKWGKAGFSPDTKAKLSKVKNADRSKSRYLSIQAKKKQDDAGAGVPVPYDLFGAFRVELTFGVYVEKRAANLGDGTFGLQVENSENPDEFYRVFARYRTDPEGLEVFAETHDGPQGEPAVFTGTLVDAAVESDGVNLVMIARSADGGSPEVTLATALLASPTAAHQAMFAVSGIQDRSQVGFSNLAIPENSPPLGYLTASSLGREVESNFMEGVRKLFDLLRLANNGVPGEGDVAAMQTLVASARLDFQVAGGVAVALEANRASATVIKQTKKIDRHLEKLQPRLDAANPKGTGNLVLNTLTKKLLGPVKKVLDALPDLGGAREPPEGIDLYTESGVYYLINRTGKPLDINDVVIDVTSVTYWRKDGEGKEYSQAGAPFRVSYREEDPETYNDDPDNFNDRVFEDSFFSLTEYVDFNPPVGVVRYTYRGQITVDTVQTGKFSIPFEFSYGL